MGEFVASECVKLLIQKELKIKSSRALILGFTFKENCPDIRNTGVNLVREGLISYGLQVDVHDQNADNSEVNKHYGFELIDKPSGEYDLIVLAVAHKEFLKFDFENLMHQNTLIYDIKSVLIQSDKAL